MRLEFHKQVASDISRIMDYYENVSGPELADEFYAELQRPILKLRANTMISAEELVGEEWAEWYSMTPMERWRESSKLWEVYLSMGGSLDPEPDTQSPFFDPMDIDSFPVDRREIRLVRRDGVRTFELISELDGTRDEN